MAIKRKPKCVLAGRPCPRNGSPERGDYCPWWQYILSEGRSVGVCGVAALPEHLNRMGGRVEESARSVQSARNELARTAAVQIRALALTAGGAQKKDRPRSLPGGRGEGEGGDST